MSADPDADEGHETDTVGEQFMDDQVEGTEAEEGDPQAPPEQFVPPHQELTQQGTGSPSWSTDQ